jgi:hypothetical protein
MTTAALVAVPPAARPYPRPNHLPRRSISSSTDDDFVEGAGAVAGTSGGVAAARSTVHPASSRLGIGFVGSTAGGGAAAATHTANGARGTRSTHGIHGRRVHRGAEWVENTYNDIADEDFDSEHGKDDGSDDDENDDDVDEVGVYLRRSLEPAQKIQRRLEALQTCLNDALGTMQQMVSQAGRYSHE